MKFICAIILSVLALIVFANGDNERTPNALAMENSIKTKRGVHVHLGHSPVLLHHSSPVYVHSPLIHHASIHPAPYIHHSVLHSAPIIHAPVWSHAPLVVHHPSVAHILRK